MSKRDSKQKKLALFGGEKPWNASDWTASDDRVRGGKSQSYLDISNNNAHFHGTLDITTLGGAGFASQRTVFDSSTWDLSDYDGIQLQHGKSDGKRYTFILKDEILPPNPENGREQSTTSWEYDFVAGGEAAMESESVYMPWKAFEATYRGKPQEDAGELDTKSVKRFNIMMRSFFGDQEGDFSLTVRSIKAVALPKDLDLEKGIANVRRDVYGRQPGFLVSTLVGVLGLGLFAYGVCVYICPWLHKMRTDGHWW
ncbi:CIA30-domain-containing protein [Byssothecium circinans]|uniref:CIA30-domain-containing protein n=1 Tax=Byssothecium circinans TaxID=147558 RepID=A0A6A5TX17_9PLEO|nr:CIA30-domain-containing protein [Byssothecium circinans]